MKLADVSLDDKYDLKCSRTYMSGTQALIRLTLMQHERDKREGLNTAGYITGYRGSPVGGVDQQFERAASHLTPRNIKFQAGLNEDLAATAIWGTQQAEMRGEGAYDGVFALWYGKGPGVDRSGDVFRHANLAGTSPNGGVLVLMGDDHTCESSTTAHQSEFALMDAMIPILNPAGVQELIDYGIYGWAMSRYSGCWIGLKAVKDTIEVTGTIDASLDRIKIKQPEDFTLPEGGLSIRTFDPPLEQEARLHDYKRYAVQAFVRANGLNKQIFAGGKTPKIGVVSSGKSYLDVRQALDRLDIDEVEAANLGLKLFKIAMSWPLEPEGVKKFARGLDLIIVVEEKRSLIETQLREQLYGLKNAPVIIGKMDEKNAPLFKAKAALDPNEIALTIGTRLLKRHRNKGLIETLKKAQQLSRNAVSLGKRKPFFCAGCPHNSSTVVPEGARAYAGIGCHWMVQVMDRKTEGYTHMGGEGANWIGEAPFSTRKHMFQNLGDGTYNHSGLQAIRAAIAADVTITYKILYNDAVAMTGGQGNDGGLTAHDIARQMAAFGVERITLVTNEADKYHGAGPLPKGTEIVERDEFARVQREFQNIDGVSVILFDQTCAAEKRRRRKRGQFPDPAKRVFINELVCEGCGDCGIQSNCVAISPVETEFGRKRMIDQYSCNKDYSCLKGLCPSFVVVEGGTYKGVVQQARIGGKKVAPVPDVSSLPEPEFSGDLSLYSAVVTGVGGTGVVTIGALIGMAAHLEGKGCGVLDMTGLAQKGGSVVSHIRISDHPDNIQSIRVSAGGANLVLGCDIMGAGSDTVLGLMDKGKTACVVNTHEIYPGEFTEDADYRIPSEMLRVAIQAQVNPEKFDVIEAAKMATALTGDAIATNLFMLGFAVQKGYLPLGVKSLERAIELNGVAVEMNKNAFAWGRIAAYTPDQIWSQIGEDAKIVEAVTAPSLDEIIEKRAAYLTDYQNAAYATRYRQLVNRVRDVETSVMGKAGALSEAVAKYYFKLMSYKDEYEVARLYAQTDFLSSIERQFEGNVKISFQLAPPLFATIDEVTGRPVKKSYGPWMRTAFGILARLKGLRGSFADPFGYSLERKAERRLIENYEAMIGDVVQKLNRDNHATAVEIAGIPEQIRGFGVVKSQSMEKAQLRQKELLVQFNNPDTSHRAVA